MTANRRFLTSSFGAAVPLLASLSFSLAARAMAAPAAPPTAAAPSPGQLALLASEPGAADLTAAVTAGLAADAPATRAVAARLAHVAGVAPAAPALREALRAEVDPGAALEQCRALAALGTEQDVREVLAVGERFPGLSGPLSAMLAREKGMGVLALLEDAAFRNLELLEGDRRRVVEHSTGARAADLAVFLARCLDIPDLAYWRAGLVLALDRRIRVAPELLIRALESSNAGVRIETAWFLAALYRDTPAARPRELLAALEKSGSLEPPSGTRADDAMGFELLARALGRPARESAEWIRHLETSYESRVKILRRRDTDLGAVLTGSEAEALYGHDRRCGQRSGAVTVADGDRSVAAQPSLLRTVAELPAGVMDGAIAACGCVPGKKDGSAVAELRYDASGRPERVRWREQPASRACRRAAAAVFALALAPLDQEPRGADVLPVALFLDPKLRPCESPGPGRFPLAIDSGECRDEATAGARVEAPRISHQVPPRYPDGAKSARREGLVVIEATISERGCVQAARVIRGGSDDLALASLAAVSQWLFKPGLVAGQPVPVHFTLTVNFSLR